mmetsp:Transcript_14940/g.47629  ORF Transcript_14940/g.47629 Transcript_14940/m.47629 type:complete len:269 (-) Transcript_14940:68-874(-)
MSSASIRDKLFRGGEEPLVTVVADALPQPPSSPSWLRDIVAKFVIASDAKRGRISVDEFDAFCRRFGPLETAVETAVANLFVADAMEPWFHGAADRKATEDLLREHGPGAFLVRFSATHPSCLVLYSVRADRSIRSQLFRRVEGGFQNLMPSAGEASEVYPRIMNYVKGCPEKFCTAVPSTLAQECNEEIQDRKAGEATGYYDAEGAGGNYGHYDAQAVGDMYEQVPGGDSAGLVEGDAEAAYATPALDAVDVAGVTEDASRLETTLL